MVPNEQSILRWVLVEDEGCFKLVLVLSGILPITEHHVTITDPGGPEGPVLDLFQRTSRPGVGTLGLELKHVSFNTGPVDLKLYLVIVTERHGLA